MARINPNSSGSSEQLFDTEIPDLSDNANIQEALRMYHYGNADASIPSTNSQISGGIANYIKTTYAGLSQLQQQGIGSAYSSSLPSSVPNGYVWVNSSSSAPQSFSTKIVYQPSAPTSDLFDGMVWIDKDSTPLTMYVYDADSSTWKAIGS